MPRRTTQPVRPAWILALWLTCAVSLSAWISAAHTPGADPALHAFGTRLLGVSRNALSRHFHDMADIYFHRGIGPRKTIAFDGHLLQRWRKSLSPRYHVHLEGMDVQEVMPWLWLAIRANPADQELYLMTAFALEHDCLRPDLAVQILQEGRWNNPKTYPTVLEEALVELRRGNLDRTRALLNLAQALWPAPYPPENETARMDQGRILLYSALAHEATGDIPQAVRDLRRILELFPEREHLKERILEMEKGTEPSLLASGPWRDILIRDVQSRSWHACDHEGDASAHGHHPPEDHGPSCDHSQHAK